MQTAGALEHTEIGNALFPILIAVRNELQLSHNEFRTTYPYTEFLFISTLKECNQTCSK